MSKRKILIQSNTHSNREGAHHYMHQTYYAVVEKIYSDTNSDKEIIISFTEIKDLPKNNPIKAIEMSPLGFCESMTAKLKVILLIYLMDFKTLVLETVRPIGWEYLILRLLGIKIINHYHAVNGSVHDIFCDNKPKWKKKVESLLMKLGFCPHLHIFVSHAENEKFLKIMGTPKSATFEVCHNVFINHSSESHVENIPINPKKKLLMMDCRMIKEKGVDIFLKAISMLNSSTYNQIEVALFGEGKDLEYYKNLATHLQLNKVVTFYGLRTNSFIQNVKKKAYLVICPSQCEEAFCLSAFEGLGLNVPVIASKKGGLTEIIHHEMNGLLYEPFDDANALKFAIEKLVEDEILRNKLARGSHLDSKHPIHTTLEQKAEELIHLYCN